MSTTIRSAVVYVDSSGGIGGLYGHGLSAALTRMGVKVRAVCPWDAPAERAAGILLEYLGSPPRGLSRRIPGSILRTWRFAAAWIRGPRDARVIVAICNHAEALIIGLLLRVWRPKFGSYFVVHDPVPHRWFLPVALRSVEVRVAQNAYRLYGDLVVHTQYGRSLLIARGCDPRRVHYCRLPSLRDAPQDAAVQQRRGIVLLGSLRADKDYAGVVQAYQALPSSLKDAHLLRIVGRPLKGFDLEALRRLIARDPSGIHSQFAFVAHAEYVRLLLSSRVCVVPYAAPSSASAVAIEAAEAGCQLIMPMTGSLAELGLDLNAIPWPDTLLDRTRTLRVAVEASDLAMGVASTVSYHELAAICAASHLGAAR